MAPHHRKLANLEVKINDLERKYEAIKKVIEDKFGAVVDVSLTSTETETTEEQDLSSTSSTTDDDLTNVPSNDSQSLIPTDDATDYDNNKDKDKMDKLNDNDDHHLHHENHDHVDNQRMIEDCYQKKLIVKISRLPLSLPHDQGQDQDKSIAVKRDYVVNVKPAPQEDVDVDDDSDIEFKLNSKGELKTYANLMVANKKRRMSPPYKPMPIISSPEGENSNDVQIVAVVNGQNVSQIQIPHIINNTTKPLTDSTIHQSYVNTQEIETDDAELVHIYNNRKIMDNATVKVDKNEGRTKPQIQTLSDFIPPPTVQEVEVEESSKLIMNDLKPVQNIDTNTNEGHNNHKKEESDDDITNEELFLCSFCNLDCVTQLGLGYHLALMHSSSSHHKQNYAALNRNKNASKCLECHQICANEVELSKHIKIHNGGKGKKKQYKRPPPPPPPVVSLTKEKCPQCDKLIEKANLSRHIKQVHTSKNTNISVPAAPMKTSPPSSVSPLSASTPSGASCEDNINIYDDLTTPTTASTPTTKPLCELCGIQFETKVYLEAHVKNIHLHNQNQKKKCTYACTEPNCSLVFPSKISQKNHTFTHLSEEEQAEYRALNYAPCPICKKEYKKVSLKTHIKRHNSNSSMSSSLASPPSSTYIPSTINSSNNNNNSHTAAVAALAESQNNNNNNNNISSISVGHNNINNSGNNNNNLILFNDFNEGQASMYSSGALVNSVQQVNNNINSMMMMNQQMINNNNNSHCLGVSSQNVQSQNVMNTPQQSQSQSSVVVDQQQQQQQQQHQFQPYKPVEHFPSLEESFVGLDLPMPMAEDYEIGDGMGMGMDIFQDIFTNITDDTFQDILSSVDD